MPRTRGSKNKRTIELEAFLEKNNFNPAQALIDMHNEALSAYKDDKGLHHGKMGTTDQRHKYLEIATRAASDLMQYSYPKRKAIDIQASEEALETFADIAAAAKKRKKANAKRR